MCSASKPAQARAVIDQMESAGLRPDATLYEGLVTELTRVGMFDEADLLYREALDRGLMQPSGGRALYSRGNTSRARLPAE